jgi:hypothetical protein
MTFDHIDRLVRQANPVPDPAALDPVASPVLLLDDHRRTDMQTYEDVTHPRLDKAPARRGLLVAAIATAAAACGAAPTRTINTRAATTVREPRRLDTTSAVPTSLDRYQAAAPTSRVGDSLSRQPVRRSA